MSTLVDRLDREDAFRSVVFLTGSAPERVSWARLIDDARQCAAGLKLLGVEAGARVAALGQTSRAFVTSIIGTWLSGATICVLPLPARGQSLERFAKRTHALARHVEPTLIVTDANLLEIFVGSDLQAPCRAITADELGRLRVRRSYTASSLNAADIAILQYTSGSTAEPKAVLVPHKNLLANVDAIRSAAGLDSDMDRCVSWLPLFHDMGLVGLLALPMVHNIDLILGDTSAFLGRPINWLRWISEFRGTVTSAPNFAYSIVKRALGADAGLDLRSLRRAFNGAEAIDPQAVYEFLAAGRPFGLNEDCMLCGYGMAESTLVATLPDPDNGIDVDVVDSEALNSGYAAPVTEQPRAGGCLLTRLGRPVPGLDLRIVDTKTAAPLADRSVGEIELRGTSITPGYFRAAAQTASAFRGEWYRTGDAGYVTNGDLVVVSRLKELIILAGRNVRPEDLEKVAARVDGVRAGCVAAFGVPAPHGTEAVVVVAECRPDAAVKSIRDAIARALQRELGINPMEIVIVQRGTLPKTSSGKVQRRLCCGQYVRSELQCIA